MNTQFNISPIQQPTVSKNTPFQIDTSDDTIDDATLLEQPINPAYQPKKPEPIQIDTDYSDLFDETKDEEFAKTKSKSSVPIPSWPNDPVKGRKIMEMMGYEEGKGLGARNQGRTSHIKVTPKTSMSGLGMEEERTLPPSFKVQRHDPDTTEYPYEQKIQWLHCENPISNTAKIYKMTISKPGENPLSNYCIPQIVEQIMKQKSEFDDLNPKIFIDARYRANPYERIGKSIFQNRAAIKMANIDKVAKLTEVKKLEEEKNMLYFCDICAGPGGFTEFIYYKYKTEGAKGWGITLKGKDDFRLDKFNPDSPHDNFEICYGEDGTGDITKNSNIKKFGEVIDAGTNGRGVALLTADGGFSVQGNENEQEHITKQLILCQCITAMYVLRKGGNFMCKVFDLYSTFSVSLLYILYQNFEQFAIFKPFASRPANSERYIICKGLRARKPAVVNYLFEVNNKISAGENVTALVDLEAMDKDIEFKDYITTSNIVIGKRQLKFLKKIKQCVEDVYLENKKQQIELQKKCLEYWGLPAFFTETRRRDYRSSRGRGGYYGNKRYNRLRPDLQQDQYRAPRPRGYTHPTTGDEWGVSSKPQYPSYQQRSRGYSSSSYRTTATKRTVDDLYSNPSKSKEEQAEEIRRRHMNTEEWTKVEKKKEESDTYYEKKEDEELDLEKAYQGFE